MDQRLMEPRRFKFETRGQGFVRLCTLGQLLFMLSLVFTDSPVWSQAFFPMEGVPGNGRFIEPPRGSIQQMKTATEAAKQGRYADAVVTLGDLIAREQVDPDDELSGQDFFIDSPTDARSVPVVNKSFIAEAKRLLSEMPKEAQDTYELRYGAQARKALDEAKENRDWQQVILVKRKFFHSEAGRDATQLLIHRSIAEGRIGLAKRLIAELVTHPKLSEANKAAVDSLKGALVSAPSTSDSSGVESAGKYSQATRRSAAQKDFPYFEAPNSDGQTAGGQLPLASLRYAVPTFGIDRQERTLKQSLAQLTSVGELPPPSWLPIRVGDYVLMRNTEILVGVDFKTGKRIWTHPWNTTESKPVENQSPLEGLPDDEAGGAILRQRVWNDLPYGRITSDRRNVYLLGDLPQMQVAALSPLLGFQGNVPTNNGSNSLIAVDLATEGKLVWKRGGEDDTDGVSEGEFYLCPPLPVEGELYVLAELAGDIVLMCLDPATGAELWRQQLLAVESGTIENDPVRRVAGGAMAYQDGLLVCSTGAGAILAVDLLDRSLVWGVSCERNDALTQNMMGRRDGSMTDQLMRRWWDSTPMIDGNRVYVTAIEADRLFILNLFTGEKIVRELPRSQYNSRYLAGIHDNAALLVGSDNLLSWDAKTGKNRWKSGSQWLESGELICGKGVFGRSKNEATGEFEDTYFVPTTSNRVVAISLTNGAMLAERSCGYQLGNLVAVDGAIISQGVTMMVVAYGQESLEPAVAAALKQNPDDAYTMGLKAQLLIEQGQRGEALQWLNKARAMLPEDLEIRQLSIKAMLGALREDFKANAPLLAELEQLIDEPEQLVELIKLQVRSAISQGQSEIAVQKLIELSTLVANTPSLNGEAGSGESEATRNVSLDAWVAARAVEAFEIADQAQLEAMTGSIKRHLGKASLYNLNRQQRMIAQFGQLPGGEELVQSLFVRFLEQQQWFEAERLILASASATPDTTEKLKPWQAIALARVYASSDMKPDALAMLESALGDEPAAQDAAKKFGFDLNTLAEESRGGDYQYDWSGELKLITPPEPVMGRIAMFRRQAVAENKRIVGKSYRSWQLISEDGSAVALRDPLGNSHPVPVEGVTKPDQTQRQVVFSGGLMIAVLPGELVAVNLFALRQGAANPVLWRRAWRSESSGAGFRRRSEATSFGDQLYRYVVSTGGNGSNSAELQLGPIIGDTLYLLQGAELLAIDVTKPDASNQGVRWRNLDAPRDGAIVSDGNVVAVVSPSAKAVIKFDCRDGHRLGEEPFTDYRLWASTDSAVLMYRDLPDGKRELLLRDPIKGETLLEHTFTDLINDKRVFGRLVDGHYVVTLSTTGEVLIWDLKAAKVICENSVEPVTGLTGLHVLPRSDSLVLLPAAVNENAQEAEKINRVVQSGDSHVRVDGKFWAVGLNDGKTRWECKLQKSWGCTLTQSQVSPLVVLTATNNRYLPAGGRSRSIDVLTIDTRNGSVHPSDDLPTEYANSELETKVTVQPAQQRVLVNVGSMMLDYYFGERIIGKSVPDDGLDDPFAE